MGRRKASANASRTNGTKTEEPSKKKDLVPVLVVDAAASDYDSHPSKLVVKVSYFPKPPKPVVWQQEWNIFLPLVANRRTLLPPPLPLPKDYPVSSIPKGKRWPRGWTNEDHNNFLINDPIWNAAFHKQRQWYFDKADDLARSDIPFKTRRRTMRALAIGASATYIIDK